MSLRDWIRVATPATTATLAVQERPTVAKVATVAMVGESVEIARRRWRVRRPDGLREVRCAPAATLAEVILLFPGTRIEPLPDAPTRSATPGEAAELRALIGAILAADTEAERAEALAVALADPDAALTCLRAIFPNRAP